MRRRHPVGFHGSRKRSANASSRHVGSQIFRHASARTLPAPTNSDTARATASGCSNSRKCPARGRSTTRTRSPNCSRKRMPIPRRRRFIIEPLDHEKGGCSGAPPIFERHAPAGREMREMTAGQHSTCASIFGSDAGESQRAPSTVTQSLPFILALSHCENRAERRRGGDEATRRKQRYVANQRRPIDCQTAGDPVAEGMTDEVRRTTIRCLNDASHITGQIVQVAPSSEPRLLRRHAY